MILKKLDNKSMKQIIYSRETFIFSTVLVVSHLSPLLTGFCKSADHTSSQKGTQKPNTNSKAEETKRKLY